MSRSALSARSYAEEGSIGLELSDWELGWTTSGVWTLEAGPDGPRWSRGAERPRFASTFASLASAYL